MLPEQTGRGLWQGALRDGFACQVSPERSLQAGCEDYPWATNNVAAEASPRCPDFAKLVGWLMQTGRSARAADFDNLWLFFPDAPAPIRRAGS